MLISSTSDSVEMGLGSPREQGENVWGQHQKWAHWPAWASCRKTARVRAGRDDQGIRARKKGRHPGGPKRTTRWSEEFFRLSAEARQQTPRRS
jgi:hypothetical protein